MVMMMMFIIVIIVRIRGTGVKGYWQGNQELLVVSDKVGRPQMSLG